MTYFSPRSYWPQQATVTNYGPCLLYFTRSYWPVSFGEAAHLGLERGARLGDELPVDFVTPGVASLRAVHSAD